MYGMNILDTRLGTNIVLIAYLTVEFPLYRWLVLITSIYSELQVLSTFAINRFANKNVLIYYNMVRGRQLQLLDSQFGLT